MTGIGKLAVDAGGSGTRVLVVRADGQRLEFQLPSINPSSSGTTDGALLHLLRDVREALAGTPAAGWLASAAVDPERIGRERERVARLAALSGLHIRLVLSNDLVPLLWGGAALNGAGVVIGCGTGSGFIGGDGRGALVRAGGCEYLGSDEGSGFDLGLAGLRAAVRATDGRGPRTMLTETLTDFAGYQVRVLARKLAAEPYPKERVAALAPAVCRAWLDGDETAGEVVDAAIGHLLLGAQAVRARLDLPSGHPVAVTGSVPAGCPRFHRELARRLVTELGPCEVELVADTPAAVLNALERMAGANGLPEIPAPVLGHHIWTLTT